MTEADDGAKKADPQREPRFALRFTHAIMPDGDASTARGEKEEADDEDEEERLDEDGG